MIGLHHDGRQPQTQENAGRKKSLDPDTKRSGNLGWFLFRLRSVRPPNTEIDTLLVRI